jgi:hypothetical protein
MKLILRVVLTALMVLGVARAEEACRADIEKLCAGVLKGDGRILTCLDANQAQLSPACKQVVSVVAKKTKEIGAACGDDVWKLCPDVRVGGGRVLKCLASNGSKLSAGCKPVVQQTEEKSAEFKKVCGADVEKLCPGVASGQGRVLACLRGKEAELAPACKTLMQPLLAMPSGAAPAEAPAAPPAAAPAAAPAAQPAAPAAAPPAAPAAAPPAAPAAAQPAAPAPPPAQTPPKG